MQRDYLHLEFRKVSEALKGLHPSGEPDVLETRRMETYTVRESHDGRLLEFNIKYIGNVVNIAIDTVSISVRLFWHFCLDQFCI